MLNYAETTSVSTIVSVASLPQDQHQDATASTFSYVIGPIDPKHIITMHAQLSTGDECFLLLPVHLPRQILDDPAFRDGYEYNYLSEEECGKEEEDWMTSVARLVNHIFSSLTDARLYRDILTGRDCVRFPPLASGLVAS